MKAPICRPRTDVSRVTAFRCRFSHFVDVSARKPVMARMPQTSTRQVRGPAHPRLCITDGTLEALKWVGLLLMAGDHINKYLLHEGNLALYALGRLVMPIFGFVLMYNLARPGAFASNMHIRVMQRLAVFALLATPASVYLMGWWPLNILFTLFVATLLVWLLERDGLANRLAAAAVFLVGGAIVEFWWPALLCCLGAWAFFRRPSVAGLALWALAVASLAVVNGNFAALFALPLVGGAAQVDVPLRRSRWVFYAFYPAHLSLLALARSAL
ncbi:TraX family protein [Variovorax sp. J22R24]|uniref:TraX family protein n=1 Tax=Variovorax gracilis TaxID=3053502 RepID=UPI002578839D|nr:TraX family protein [Variovorax sp. J22R24]MDM0108019.1 TraX family protein [Variovorax sp. J22R24]